MKCRIRILRTVIQCIVMCFLMGEVSLPAYAKDNTAQKTIRIGYYEFAGFQEQDADGKRTGYGYDFLQEVARYTGWHYDYVGYDQGWATLQKMLDEGQIDMLPSARKTPEREKKYLFSDAMGTSSGILTVKSGNTRVTIGDYSTYNGLRIGVIENSSINEKLKEFAKEKGFTYTEVDYLNAEDLNNDLQSEKNIDAVCTTDLRKTQNEWILDRFATADFYIMMRKSDTGLQAELNEAIAKMNLYSPGWQTKQKEKYYAADMGDAITFTAAEKNYIERLGKQKRVISVALNPDNYPYSYFENGTAQGIMADLIRAIARRTGIPVTIPEIKDRNAYIDTLSQRKADVIGDSAFDYYQAEKNRYRLTIPYLSTPVTELRRSDFAGTARTMAVLQDGDEKVPTLQRQDTEMKQKCYASTDACVQAVESGEVDVTYLYPYSAQKYLNTSKGAGLSATLMPDYSISFALGVSEDDDLLLLEILNKGVFSVNSDYTNTAILKQVAMQHEDITPMEYLIMHPYYAVILVLFASVIISMCFIFAFRERTFRIIRVKNRQLSDLNRQLESAAEAKSNFLSNISHDLRTPLNGIIGYTEFAIGESQETKKQEYLQKARQAGLMMRDLINDTLDISKIESGKFTLNKSWIHEYELIQSVINVVHESADRKKIDFQVDVECPEDEEILADPVKIREIFLNLLNNAIKYTAGGGWCRLTVRRTDETPQHVNLTIRVEDNGIGISSEFLPSIFEPFMQESDAQTNDVPGTGLGLAIVKRIVEMMDGTVRAESEKNKGSTFTVMLPLEIRVQGTEQKKENSENDDLSGRKILLCEDNSMNAEIASIILKKKHAEVVCAENGRQGLELFSMSQKGEYTAVLMDIHMPLMDGYETTRAIRNLKRDDAQKIPIIAMTADAYSTDIQRCLENGMNAHVSKPVDPDRLYRVIVTEVKKAEQPD